MGITKMAKGKNKQISKKGGARGKQERHPFSKKQWYKIQSPPNVHNSVQVGWTPVNRQWELNFPRMVYWAESAMYHTVISKTQLTSPGKRSECKSKKLRDQPVTLHSMVSTSSERNFTTT